MWLCADGLYEVPCSHVTHSFRMHNPSRQLIKEDFVGRNFKRLVEVWFDEYKDVVYRNDRKRFEKVDAGDLSHVKNVRDRLKCKPFKYFINEIAPDILERYPLQEELPVFASGQIRTIRDSNVCVDLLQNWPLQPIGLYRCWDRDDEGNWPGSQNFRLTFFKNIALAKLEYCLDAFDLATPQCHYMPYGNQYWKYDHNNYMLINGHDFGTSCLTANLENFTLEMQMCDLKDEKQKWTWSYVNRTALDDWTNTYGYKKLSYGDRMYDRSRMLPLEVDQCQ